MASINNQWSVGAKLAFEDTEIGMQDDSWEGDHSREVPAYHKRRTAGLWTALATLAVALVVAASYGYSVISKNNAQLAWLPGLTKSLSAVRGRLDGLETRLQVWQDGQKNLAARIQQMDAGWKSKLNDVRLHAAKLVNDAYQKEQEELNLRTAAINAQMVQMASRQRAEQIHMAQLEQDLARTRQELASVRENYTRELAGLREQQTSNRREIASINNLLATDEVDFEITKNQGEEIVPGVSLHLTKTDTQRQRFQGWIWLAGNRHTIWVRGQGIQRPVVFYPKAGGEAYELVVTRVNQKDATGYLLIPRDAATQQAALGSHKESLAGNGPLSF